jgi:PAS domain S-box-containing protein
MPDPVTQSRQLDHNPEFVNAILNAAASLILVVDVQGHIVRFNRACEEATGYDAVEVLGRPFFDIFLRPEDREIKRAALSSICNHPSQATQMNETEVVWLDKTGSPLCVAWNYTALCDETGTVCWIVSVGTEISGQRRIEKALRESEERYALALQGANDGIWDWNLQNGDVYFSPRWKAMLGYSEDEIGHEAQDWWERVHSADKENLETAVQQHLAGITPHLECEYRILHKDGTYRWMLARGLAIRDEKGKPHRMAGSQTDMTEWKVTEHQLLHDVFHDSLTGLPNRVVFLERVEQMLARARRKENDGFAVLFLDLNGFKNVNDQLGHPIGDQLLKAVASRLKRCLRRDDTVSREVPQIEPPIMPSLPGAAEMKAGAKPKLAASGTQDMVARLGGDEFTVVLENITGADEVQAVARRIYEELDRPFNLSGQIVQVGVSIGIVLSSPQQQSSDDLISQADAAMYEAKEKSRVSGQSQACIYQLKS